MTTSGEYNLDLSLNSVINEAYEILQATGQGETLGDSGTLFTQARNSLNMLLKMWEAQGIHLWTYTEYTLFLVKGQAAYDFRLPATRLVNSFQSTTLSAAEAIGQDTWSVTSSANMSIGQVIGVIDEVNELFWTVIERIPDATSVVVRDALTTAAPVNAIVRHYDTANLGTTTLSAAEALGQTTISLTSVVGIATNYTIGILQDDNSVHFSTVNSVDADANTVVINDATTVAAAMGNAVFFFSSEQNFIPLSRILDDGVRRHSGESSDYEIPIVFESREDYFQLPNKNQQGTPIQAYYSRQEPQGIMYLWNTPSTATEYINFSAERQIQIMEASPTQTFDLPSEWFLALSYNLAKLLAHKVGCSPQRKAEVREDANVYLNQALSFDQAVYGVRLNPQRYG